MRRPRQLHPWDVTPKEAVAIQQRLRSKVIVEKLDRPVRYVAGCDLSAARHSDVAYAGIVVLELPDLVEAARSSAVTRVRFPYIPGLLSFRETPALLEAWRRLAITPDLLMVDGHGLAHPRRFGIACHLGVLLDLPTIGCAKSPLAGSFVEPGLRAGSYSMVTDDGVIIGAALRTVDRVRPIFVSVGHRVTLEEAIFWAIRCSKGYRIPEPTRRADILVNALRRGS
ncbi:MAG TPA: deoxyribonuclease V [candidate division Zixibacteria bacterium]|nr:deoxyribonuclease V [candidate division Zixibacteria bacterium]